MGSRAWQTIALKTRGEPLTVAQPHSAERALQLATALKGRVKPLKECALEEAFREVKFSKKIAVGAYPGGDVILNFDIANELIFGGRSAARILDALASPDVAAIVAHSVSSFWGYAIYKDRILLRASSGGDGEWNLNEGPALAAFEPELVGLRIEKTEEDGYALADVGEDDEISAYGIGDEAAMRITDHYLQPDLWCELRCTVFETPGFLARLFGA